MKASKTIVWKDPNGDEFTLQEMIDELMILRGVNVNLHALLYKDKVKIGLVADAEIKVRQSYFQDLIDESARKRKELGLPEPEPKTYEPVVVDNASEIKKKKNKKIYEKKSKEVKVKKKVGKVASSLKYDISSKTDKAFTENSGKLFE